MQPLESYLGILDHKKMTPNASKAYRSWGSQRQRCSNVKLRCYKYYGGKGVTVKYGPREFIAWYLRELELKNYHRPTTGRINHDGDYEFGNVRIEEQLDNCITDVFKRHGPPGEKMGEKVAILHSKTKELFSVAFSHRQAADMAGCSKCVVTSILNKRSGRENTRKGLAEKTPEKV